jgi:hypothetical protein
LHADFISGWDRSVLQSAVVECTNPSGEVTDCPVFNVDTDAQNSCQFSAPEIAAVEECRGPREGLCGNPATDAVQTSAPTATPAPAAASSVAPHGAPEAQELLPGPEPTTLHTAIRSPSMHTEFVTDWVDATLTVTDFVKRAAPTGGFTVGDRRFFS